jgi:molybdate/tungstate transport system substrate-binding protein
MNPGWRRLLWIAGTVAVLAGSGGLLSRGCADRRRVVHVLAADALATALGPMEEIFERENPDIDLRVIVEGSVMLLRRHLLHPADVLMLADDRLIETGLRSEDADWMVRFATTELVIAYTQASRHAAEITAENWPEILLRPEVLVGHPDPSIDPCGYYTRLAWKLMERRAAGSEPPLSERLAEKSCAPYQRPDALTVLALLQARAIDYAFVYRCHAADHRLPYLRLPEEVNLGRPELADEYAHASVDVPDYRGQTVSMRGHPIAFGLTVSRRSRCPEEAGRFVRFVLSPGGQGILRQSEIVPLLPARAPAWSVRLPPSLAELVAVDPAPGAGG